MSTHSNTGTDEWFGFGILYLITAAGLVLQLNNPEAQDPAAPHLWEEREVEELIAGWYAEYPEIREMQELAFWQVQRYGMVWDMFGRTRLVPEVYSGLPWVVEAGERRRPIWGFRVGPGGR